MCTPPGRYAYLGVLGRLAEANHDVSLRFPSYLESGPREPNGAINWAIKGHPKGAQDHPRDGQTRPLASLGKGLRDTSLNSFSARAGQGSTDWPTRSDGGTRMPFPPGARSDGGTRMPFPTGFQTCTLTPRNLDVFSLGLGLISSDAPCTLALSFLLHG